ncbi:MAG: hypothetical protein WAL56_06080 [Candidatus Sulfotelmatobacter sp.]
MKPSAILLVSCPDAKGEVATIADFVYHTAATSCTPMNTPTKNPASF